MPKAIFLSSVLASFRIFVQVPSCVALQFPFQQPQNPQQSSNNNMQKRKLLETAHLVRQTLPSISEHTPFQIPHPEDLRYPTYYIKPNGTRRGFSNWLVPNRIIIGQYPSQTPEKDGPSLACVRNHIGSLVASTAEITSTTDTTTNSNSNVRLFCCLQSELPPQDDDKAWNRVNGKVYLPPERGDVGRNKEFPHFFGRYLPLVNDALLETNSKDVWTTVRYHHAPILDLDTPDHPSSLFALLTTLLEAMLLPQPSLSSQPSEEEHRCYAAVYIHCWGGRGRAGLVGACLLSVLYPELSPDDCLEWVQSGYDTRYGAESMPWGLRRSPQTEKQREFVRLFVQGVRNIA